MHEYYQNASGKLQKTMRSFLLLVRPELEEIMKQPYDAAFAEIWKIYARDMLGRFAYIGGDKVSGTGNLTQAYMPYLCNLDYVMFGILGAPLFRSRTCFEDDCCDFNLKLGAKPLSYTPPVFLQDNEYK